MERRLDRLEQRLGGSGEDCGQLAIIAPNSWSDADREAWERAEILHDATTHDDLIEKYSGHRPRPCRAVVVMIVPAPAKVERASEEDRAAWRAQVGTSPWRNDGQASSSPRAAPRWRVAASSLDLRRA